MIEKSLQELGLSPAEIKVFLSLSQNGPSYANQISKEIKLHRTNVYEALDRLSSKGLVSYIKRNNLTWYEAKDPTYLLKILEQKKQDLDTTKKKLQEEIKSLTSLNKNHLEAGIYVGKKGLRMLFEDILETEKPISLIAAQLQFKEFFGPYFELWHKQRAEKKIAMRSIFPKSMKSKLTQRPCLQYKFVSGQFTNPTTTIIYANNCVLIEWGDEPVAIKIQSEKIVKTHLNYFNLIWER
ncbi:hypothetical protein HYV86_00220 [Candidatus Woesearchaeota archaeon]|nr:hypothetical protein [Candidatus Woesearchaeota archaeon]